MTNLNLDLTLLHILLHLPTSLPELERKIICFSYYLKMAYVLAFESFTKANGANTILYGLQVIFGMYLREKNLKDSNTC